MAYFNPNPLEGKLEGMGSGSALLAANLHRLVCPVCHAQLALAAGWIDCAGCLRRYPIVDGLPVLMAERATLSGEQTGNVDGS